MTPNRRIATMTSVVMTGRRMKMAAMFMGSGLSFVLFSTTRRKKSFLQESAASFARFLHN
jgi:hypothetical protein